MGEVVMPAGKEGQRYSRRGARAAARLNNRNYKLIRIEGETYTVAQVMERVPLPERSVLWQIQKMQKRGEPITWDKLRNAKLKPREAPNV